MAKQNQAVEAQPDKKSRHISEPTIVAEPVSDWIGLAELPIGPIGAAGDGSVEAQAARLTDGRWQSAQRRALAIQIGRMQGNHHLQRLAVSLKGDDESAPYQSNNG